MPFKCIYDYFPEIILFPFRIKFIQYIKYSQYPILDKFEFENMFRIFHLIELLSLRLNFADSQECIKFQYTVWKIDRRIVTVYFGERILSDKTV